MSKVCRIIWVLFPLSSFPARARERERERISDLRFQISISACGELALPEKETAKRHFPLVNLTPVPERSNGDAKVQDAITRGLSAAGCTVLRPPFPLYGHYEYDTLTGT